MEDDTCSETEDNEYNYDQIMDDDYEDEAYLDYVNNLNECEINNDEGDQIASDDQANLNHQDNPDNAENSIDYEVNFDEIVNNLMELSDRDLEELSNHKDANYLYGKDDRPFTLEEPQFYNQKHRSIPLNENEGEPNYFNLPERPPKISDVLKLFVTEEMTEKIANYTNINQDGFTTDKTEIYNLIGNLTYQGFQKDNLLPIFQLYDK